MTSFNLDKDYSTLLDKYKHYIVNIDGYVPRIMCPEGSGYGDYVIMNIDENGKIDKWKINLDEFLEQEIN